jgi:hypothetical protein
MKGAGREKREEPLLILLKDQNFRGHTLRLRLVVVAVHDFLESSA